MQKQSLTKGFAVMSAAGIIVKIMSFLYIPFLMAIIGEEGTGVYGVIYQVYVFIYVIANSGIPVAISKSISELSVVGNDRDALRAFKIARSYLILLGVLLSLIMFFAATPIALMLKCEKAALGIAVLSPTLLITAVLSSYRGYFQGRGNMTPTAVSQIIEQVVNVVFTLLFAYLFKNTVEGACAGATVGTSVGALIAGIYLIYIFRRNREYKQTRKPGVKFIKYKRLSKMIIQYSIPITICIAAQYAGNLIDVRNTRSRLFSAGYIEPDISILYGLLYKYQQLINAPIAIAAALAATILPIISAAVVLKDKKQLNEKINYTFRLCFLIAIPSAVGMSVLSKQIYSILKYGSGEQLLMYGSIVLVLMSISQIQTSILQGAGKLYKVTVYLLLGIVVKILVNYFLIGIKEINIMGAIIGSIAGFIVPVILNTIEIRHSMGVNINLFKQALKPLVSSTFMGFAVWISYKLVNYLILFTGNSYVANAIATAISVVIGVMVFVVMMIVIRGITKDDLNNMPARLKAILPKRLLALVK